MKYVLSLILLLSVAICSAQDYYAECNTLYGEGLRVHLHNLIDNHQEYSYSNCIAALKESDEDPNNSNNVLLVYKETSIHKNNFAYDPSNPIHYNYWNREHVWAKSLGSFGPGGTYENSPAHTDLHHLKPSDMSVNADRSNKSFDNGGTQHTEAANCKYTNNSWEAPDNVKGDIARILFYMEIRYEGDSGEPDLSIVESLDTYPNPEIGKLSTLLEWHELDPVDDFEMNRNELIYNWQNNRNPFIDHPEFVNRIWGSDTIAPIVEIPNVFISEYIEGSSYNKAIEIYNAETTSVNLLDFELWKISNGGQWYEQSFSLSGQLESGAVFVISHSNASGEIAAISGLQVNLNHNGDDALGLAYQGQLIDIIGESGEAPSGGWDVAGINEATKDHTLIRKATINTGNTNWGNSAGMNTDNSEWIVSNIDDISNLGIHTIDEIEGQSTQTINFPEGWYFYTHTVIPEFTSLDSILAPIIEDVIIVKDEAGNVFLPQWAFNNIGVPNISEGFMIKMAQAQTLNLSGLAINLGENPLEIHEGWNLFGYISSDELNSQNFFIYHADDVIIVKNYMGAAALMEFAFDAIGPLEHGSAYLLKANNSFIVEWE